MLWGCKRWRLQVREKVLVIRRMEGHPYKACANHHFADDALPPLVLAWCIRPHREVKCEKEVERCWWYLQFRYEETREGKRGRPLRGPSEGT